MAFLAKQRAAAKRTKLTKMGTEFAGTREHQMVPAKQIRSTTYLYPPGPRRTTKPEKNRA